MNAEDKQAIRQRVEDASQGPWYIDPNGVMFDVVYDDRDLFPDGPIAVAGGDHDGACLVEDAEFIAATRTDVPALLDALDEAEADRDQWKARAEAAEAKVARHGPCICNTGSGTDGPDEFCPHHGRTYNDALDYLAREVTALRLKVDGFDFHNVPVIRAGLAQAWDEGKRAGIEQMRPTNPYRVALDGTDR